jgi:hypothetical protein
VTYYKLESYQIRNFKILKEKSFIDLLDGIIYEYERMWRIFLICMNNKPWIFNFFYVELLINLVHNVIPHYIKDLPEVKICLFIIHF